MRPILWSLAVINALVVVAVTLLLAPCSWAKPKFKVLASIPGGLWTGLTLDSKGNLYGVTSGGGTNGVGSVFEVSKDSKGKWAVTTLHSFDGTDGSSPNGNLIFDAAGNLYGTAPNGGLFDNGTVFELTPGSAGWSFAVIYNFCPHYNCPDGSTPGDGLTLDKAGNLYGTAGGGPDCCGVFYQLAQGSGGWEESVLYDFGSKPYDSTASTAPLILSKAGDLYGAGQRGGRYNGGTAFKLTHHGESWTESLLYSFGGDGWYVEGLSSGGPARFYGATLYGGSNTCYGFDCGVVFQLARSGTGRWKETVVYDFAKPEDGFKPDSPLAADKAGNLYGAAALGGTGRCTDGCGVVFKLSPKAHGKWAYAVLHKFNGTDGGLPDGGVIRDDRGNLYGTAYSVVFEITP